MLALISVGKLDEKELALMTAYPKKDQLRVGGPRMGRLVEIALGVEMAVVMVIK